MKTYGTSLIDEQGNEVLLRGVIVNGGYLIEPWLTGIIAIESGYPNITMK